MEKPSPRSAARVPVNPRTVRRRLSGERQIRTLVAERIKALMAAET
jgi:hypothetical protein